MKYFYTIFLILSFSCLLFIFSCSDSSGGSSLQDATSDIHIRTCTNSAQCKVDEKCINGVCQKREIEDTGMDIFVDSSYDIEYRDSELSDGLITDIGIDIGFSDTDITDVGGDVSLEYFLGISSVYEGSTGECSGEEYIVKSVSGYSGVPIMSTDEYTVYSGARFK